MFHLHLQTCHGISEKKGRNGLQRAWKRPECRKKNRWMGLRKDSRLYNVPAETLRKPTGLVSLDCWSEPPTVFTIQEEARLAQYCVTMAYMGFWVTWQDVMGMAYTTADKVKTILLMKALLAEGGMKVLWLAKSLSHCVHPSHSLCPTSPLKQGNSWHFFATLGTVYELWIL